MPLKTNITKRASIICAAGPWEEAMATLAELARPYLERFQALLAAAAPEDASMVSFMAAHEAAVIRIAKQEASGDGSMDRELLTMLSYPLVRSPASPAR